MTLPRRRNRTPAVLVLALLAGLVAMHGLSGPALAAPVAPAALMHGEMPGGHAAHGARPSVPVPDSPHHGPAASGHHPCLAVPASAVDLAAAAETTARALPLPGHAPVSAPTRARTDRAPPDLNELCVSRT